MRSHFVKEAICDPGKITVTSVDEKLLKKTVDYIVAHMSETSVKVETLSREIGLSRVHFYRKIKALTNLTAVEFIRTIRLKRAASLLEQKKLSVKEVADLVGFDDPEYFTKCFKKHFGVLPSDYMKNGARF
jgi:AraC-like DNA-binding protein